jgi:hypothetical protein
MLYLAPILSKCLIPLCIEVSDSLEARVTCDSPESDLWTGGKSSDTVFGAAVLSTVASSMLTSSTKSSLSFKNDMEFLISLYHSADCVKIYNESIHPD